MGFTFFYQKKTEDWLVVTTKHWIYTQMHTQISFNY